MTVLEILTFEELKDLFKRTDVTQVDKVLSALDFIGDWRLHMMLSVISRYGYSFINLYKYDLCKQISLVAVKNCDKPRVYFICKCIYDYIYNYQETNDYRMYMYYRKLSLEIEDNKPKFGTASFVKTKCVTDIFGIVQDVIHTVEQRVVRLN